MGEFNKIISFGLFLIFIKFSLEEIIIPVNSVNEENGPTIMTRETFTVQSNDGTPIRITRIGFHRNSRNLNGNNRERQTPLALMRLMDDTISSIFEEIISQRIGFNLIRGKREEENKNENNDNKNEQEKNNNEKKDNNIDNKEFELDENKDNKDKKDNKDNNKVQENKDNKETKEEEKLKQNITTAQENKTSENSKDNIKKNITNTNTTNTTNIKQEKKSGEKKKMIGKLKINPDSLKPKKRKGKKKLSRKEIIFSRICKYIFYSIILFTLYVLIRKLLELLEIIDPETDLGLKQVKTNNEEELKKKENDIVLNKKKENKQY